MVVADDVAAGRHRGRHSRFGLVVRDGDVYVNAVALWSRRAHLLEPERRTAALRIAQVCVAHLTVPEHRTPERHDVGAH